MTNLQILGALVAAVKIYIRQKVTPGPDGATDPGTPPSNVDTGP